VVIAKELVNGLWLQLSKHVVQWVGKFGGEPGKLFMYNGLAKIH